jgi:hypothetical protein
MYKIVNIFYKSKCFDLLPKFVARRLFKIFKIFFVETNLNLLPKNNHPTTLNKEDQIKIIKNSKEIFYRPFSTCAHLLETLSVYSKIKKKFTLLDFGANNIDNYIYLNKYLDNWKYIYHDLSQYNDTVSALIKENKWNNIEVLNNLSLSKDSPLDFAFFGSSIHYAEGYQEILKKFAINKSKFLIFSHTPFYISDNNDKDKVLKQVNIHPVINYAYLINYNNFIQFMKDNNYKLISQNKNNLIKFLNFKNFNKNFSFIGFLDLTFTYIDNEN